jgi:hypothetical protein
MKKRSLLGGHMLFLLQNPLQTSKRILLSFHFFLLILAFLFLSCEKSTAPIENLTSNISITLEDIAVTEIWLNLETENLLNKDIIQVFRNDSIIYTGKPELADTTLYDCGLHPAHSYTYNAILKRYNKIISESMIQNLVTMDTTSHTFFWKIDTIGTRHSILRDIAIIDDNDIWAVGEIHTEETDKYDSLGNWIDPYNAVHWDGYEWELITIYFDYQGSRFFSPINSVFAFDTDDVWFEAGIHWNGSQYQTIVLNLNFPSHVNKMWGSVSNDLFIVGDNGLIAHFFGGQWYHLDTGTNLSLSDIWGVSENEVYSVGLNYGEGRGIVLKFNGIYWQKMIEGFVEGNGFNSSQLFKTQLYGITEGVWVDEKGTVYTAGNYLYKYSRGIWNYVRSLPENYLGGNPGNYYRGYLHTIRGLASNDIFIFGESNTLIHFNGLTWRKIGPEYIPFSSSHWYQADAKGNLIVAVGKTADIWGDVGQIIRIWR